MKKISFEQLNWGLILLIFFIYLWAVLKYTVNMPFWDDYGAVLGFMNNYVESTEMTEKIKLLFAQHNEHRIVFNRVVELSQYKLIGEVNFLYLIIIGNIGWFLTIVFLWKYAKEREITIAQFLPVMLIMLSFVHFELMTWAMASLQQYYQILFSLLAIYFLINSKLIISFLFMTFSIFTGGGGVVLIPIFILYFLMRKDVKKLFIIIAISVLLLLIYFVFLNYTKPGHHPSIISALCDPILLVHYVLVFIGNIGKTKLAALIIGILTLLFFVFIGKKIYKKEPFLFWSILFILATASVTALSRVGFGVEQSLSSRYSIYSVLLLSLVYLSYLTMFKNKRVYLVGLVVGIASFTFWFNHGLSWFESQSNMVKKEILYPNVEEAENILKKSAELKVFTSWQGIKLPSSLLKLQKIGEKNTYCLGIAQQIDVCNGNTQKFHLQEKADLSISINESIKTINIEGWTVDSVNGMSSCGIVTVIGDKKQFFRLSHRMDVANALNNQNYAISGISGSIDISHLKPGKHILEIRTIDNTCSGYYETLKVPLLMEEINIEKIEKLPLSSGYEGYLDSVNNQRFDYSTTNIQLKDKQLSLTGWFVDNKNTALAKAVVIDIDGKKYLANYGLPRTDVAKALGKDIYINSGFEFKISLDNFSTQKHLLKIYVLSNDGAILYDTNINLSLDGVNNESK